jgi:hypothetical protein
LILAGNYTNSKPMKLSPAIMKAEIKNFDVICTLTVKLTTIAKSFS